MKYRTSRFRIFSAKDTALSLNNGLLIGGTFFTSTELKIKEKMVSHNESYNFLNKIKKKLKHWQERLRFCLLDSMVIDWKQTDKNYIELQLIDLQLNRIKKLELT